MTSDLPRVVVIGAGSRGNAYSKAVCAEGLGTIVAVAEPNAFKRRAFGKKYIWDDKPAPGQEFIGWKEYVLCENNKRATGADNQDAVLPGADTAFICVLDEMHVEVIKALAPLNMHILCEKPLATKLDDCLTISRFLAGPTGEEQKRIFCVGHVLRYSPMNMLLKRLLVEQVAIGDIISMEHTEPIGWWHFTHSYVR